MLLMQWSRKVFLGQGFAGCLGWLRVIGHKELFREQLIDKLLELSLFPLQLK